MVRWYGRTRSKNGRRWMGLRKNARKAVGIRAQDGEIGVHDGVL